MIAPFRIRAIVGGHVDAEVSRRPARYRTCNQIIELPTMILGRMSQIQSHKAVHTSKLPGP